MKIKKIGVISTAKVFGAVYAFLGFLMGALATIATLFSDTTGSEYVVGIVAIILFPIVYGLFGALSVAISVFIYNIATKYVGPIQIEVELEKEDKKED